MKGRTVTAQQRRFWDRLASIGCIACRKMGIHTPHVSIHHVIGRTKPHAHWAVLPLCGPHHQDMGVQGVFPVHPYKARFEEAYGNQGDLMRECIQILLDQGIEVPDVVLELAKIKKPDTCEDVSGSAHLIHGDEYL